MAFNLGNFAVKEVIYGVAHDFNGNLLYTLDQLTSAQIEVTSDPTEINDKHGNIIRQIYNNKTATFTATSALISPVLLNAQSGSDIEYASNASAITMPNIVTLAAGVQYDVSAAKSGTIQVMGIYNNGANGKVLAQGTSAVVDVSYAYDAVNNRITVPSAATDAPTMYLVTYDRDETNGMKLSNYADRFPATVRLTLYVAVMDPCSDSLRAAFVSIPSFSPDPSVTINLDSEETTADFSGNINLDFCGANKILYSIYFPDQIAVTSAIAA